MAKTTKKPAVAGPSQMATPFNSIQGGVSEEKLEFRLIHLWEACNPNKGGLLIGLELLLIDEQDLGEEAAYDDYYSDDELDEYEEEEKEEEEP